MWNPKRVSWSLSYGWSSSCDDDEEEELDLARWELGWEFGGDQSGGAGGWLDSMFSAKRERIVLEVLYRDLAQDYLV